MQWEWTRNQVGGNQTSHHTDTVVPRVSKNVDYKQRRAYRR